MPGELVDAVRLADEQAALRRVAELVAGGAPQTEVFDTVADEACRLFGGHFTALLRFEPDQPPAIVAMGGADAVGHVMHVGMRISMEGDGVVQRVRRTAQPARVEHYERVPGPNAAIAHELGLTSGVGAPIITEGQVWGAITVLGAGLPLPSSAEPRLAMFAKLVATTISNAHTRTTLAALASEQGALLRVAELVARGVAPQALFETVAAEASRLLDEQPMTLSRYSADHQLEVMASCGGPAPVGTLIVFETATLPDTLRRTGRTVRVDDYTRERDAELAVQFGLAAAVAAPIIVQGRVWGMLAATSDREPLPAAAEARLRQFSKLVASSLANGQARSELQALADEQAALRRVAELVVRGATLGEVFAAVAAEASKLLGDVATALLRYDPVDVAVVVSAFHSPAPLGLRIPAGDGTATGDVRRSGTGVQVDEFERTALADLAIELGAAAAVAVPVIVEARVWGALTVTSPGPALPAGTKERLAQFAELAGAAIANAQNKDKLTASRARVVATADDTRRQLQRDLHDGAQQRLVHTMITLQLAQQAAASGRPTNHLIKDALQHAERANRALRDLVHGILPASLTDGGLRTGLESLATEITIPVDLRVSVPRLPTQTETTAYFIVAEALTNVIKHADATAATVEIALNGDTLTITVSDDGSGGADLTMGTGLTGLLDRIEARNGTLTISSPPRAGTTLRATLPLDDRTQPRYVP